MICEENMLIGESMLDEECIEFLQIVELVKVIYFDLCKQWLYVINGCVIVDVFDLYSCQLNGCYKLLEDFNVEVIVSI